MPPIENVGFFGYVCNQYLFQLPEGVLSALYIIIILLQAIRLNLFLNELRMYHTVGLTTAMAYILLSAFFVEWSTVGPAILANTLVIWLFILLTKLYSRSSVKSLLFNIGILVGVSILCYHPTISFVPLVLFGLAIIRPFRLTEWVVLLLGMLLPFYLVISFLYLNNQMQLLPLMVPHFKIIELPKTILSNIWVWVNLFVLLVLLLAGFRFGKKQHIRMVMQVRRYWDMMLLVLLVLLPISFFVGSSGMQSIQLLWVPLSAFMANYFLYAKRLWWPNILLVLALIIIAHNNWVIIKN